jgi:glutaredoxin
MNHLLFFSGADCPHCDIMRNLIKRLNIEFDIIIEEHEVWNNEANYRLLENYTTNHDCPGIPVFINTQSGVVLCGEVSYKQLTSWAMGGNVVQ